MEKLTGIVQRVTFHSADTGWSVLKVSSFRSPKDLTTVTIHQAKVFPGATVEFVGSWVTHPKFGQQFKAEKMTEKKPASAGALEKYLGSGLIYGVGPKTAKKIVKSFGEETLTVFENNIDRLMEVPGIARAKLKQIKEAWTEHREIRNVMMFLQSHGISTLYAVKIYKKYGDKAITVVRENPYQLSKDIYGIGFFSADKIALSLGIERDGPVRVEAAIKHVLAASKDEGHCYLLLEQVKEAVKNLLEIELDELVESLLEDMEKRDELKVRRKDQYIYYYSKTLFFDETFVGNRTKALAEGKVAVEKERVEKWLSSSNFNLSDEQFESVANIVQTKFSILTGGPGCGKTTTLKALVKLIQAMGKRVMLAAPTGRAAQRMGEVIGLEAKTIHRLLVFDPATGGFKKNSEDPLDTDFLVVDECSMLDISLTASLLKAVPNHCQVLFIGDADQLPSVGAGNVLKDMISSDVVPTFRLTKIFRQAGESSIIRYAHMINKGDIPKVDSPFRNPDIWQDKVDCLFVDSNEATQEQLKFISRTKSLMGKVAEEDCYIDDDGLDAKERYGLSIPRKFMHVDLEKLESSEGDAEELKAVLKKIHPWSSLHYGLTATDMLLKLYLDSIPKYLGRGLDIQILSPMTRGSLGTNNLNKLIQDRFNPRTPGKSELLIGDRIFRIGDRVIQRRNNYDLDVFNGDIGKIVNVDNESMQLEVEFKLKDDDRVVIYEKENLIELDLAYAITIHKSQGSEFDIVILPIMTQHFKMLFRNLIYTGLTRAKKMAMFLGTRKALSLSVKNVDNRERQTLLNELLQGKEFY